jgi:DNA repair protein RadC
MKEVSSPLGIAVAEIEISYKSNVKPSDRPKITGSKDVYQLFINTWDSSKIEMVEQFKVMLLNRGNRVLGICTISTGSTTGTIVDPKQVFVVALKTNAIDIILAHNHPSGNLIPSNNDYEITQKLKAAGKLLDVKVIDHLIVSTEGYYSFADEGVI